MFTPGPSEIPTIDMPTVTAYAHFMFENTSSVGCGPGLPRIAYSQNGTSNRRCSPPGPSEIPTIDIPTVTAYVHFVFEKTSCVGCGPGLPRWRIRICTSGRATPVHRASIRASPDQRAQENTGSRVSSGPSNPSGSPYHAPATTRRSTRASHNPSNVDAECDSRFKPLCPRKA